MLGAARRNDAPPAGDRATPRRRKLSPGLTPATPRRIVLVGMMGAGKTAVGAELARRLGWRWWDNDVELQRDTGHDARTLVKERGVEAAHAEETRVLLRALALGEPVVVAAAGSVVADPLAAEALRREWVVWLRARVDTLLRRVQSGGGQHRPFVDAADARRTLERLDRERRDTYAGLASLIVDVDDLTVAECVERISRFDAPLAPG